MNGQIVKPFTNSHWFFGGSILVASACFHFLSTPFFFWIYLVVFASLILDWMTAYEEREKTDFAIFLLNIFAVFNYISIFVSMTLKVSNPSEAFIYVPVHYVLIFVNYILWNILIAKKMNIPREKRFLVRFSVMQTITILAFFLSALSVLPFFNIKFNDIVLYLSTHTDEFSIGVLVFLSIFHLLVMGFWVRQKYYIPKMIVE